MARYIKSFAGAALANSETTIYTVPSGRTAKVVGNAYFYAPFANTDPNYAYIIAGSLNITGTIFTQSAGSQYFRILNIIFNEGPGWTGATGVISGVAGIGTMLEFMNYGPLYLPAGRYIKLGGTNTYTISWSFVVIEEDIT